MSDNNTVQEQQSAPDFTLPAEGNEPAIVDGKLHLADLRGKPVVLYFYPKDDTPGCTAEACSFRDANHELQRRGVVVLGISKDTLSSHKKFASKYQLPYPLLSDTDAQVAQEYGVYSEKSMYGKKFMGVDRSTFLIDKDGIVRRVWHKVKPENHANEVLEAVEALNL
jgi:peroxiredoxin Q/BCP